MRLLVSDYMFHPTRSDHCFPVEHDKIAGSGRYYLNDQVVENDGQKMLYV